MQKAVSVSNLDFHYPRQEKKTLENINLEISKGERFGLFGPNGAGKTTLINLLTGLLEPGKGIVQLFGSEVYANRDVKKIFGYVPQDLAFYNELTPIENLEFFGAWAGLKRNEITTRTQELLTVLGLTSVSNKQVKTFSGGMKRRINIAIGVIHQPQILFLDEPTVGVDVQTRAAIIDYLKIINEQGVTLVYTSHHLQEAQHLCNRIALIDEGKIILHGDLSKLLTEHKEEGLEGLFLKLTGKAYRD